MKQIGWTCHFIGPATKSQKYQPYPRLARPLRPGTVGFVLALNIVEKRVRKTKNNISGRLVISHACEIIVINSPFTPTFWDLKLQRKMNQKNRKGLSFHTSHKWYLKNGAYPYPLGFSVGPDLTGNFSCLWNDKFTWYVCWKNFWIPVPTLYPRRQG